MMVSAPNWRGTGLRAIYGTRGLSGRCRGVGQDAGSPDVFSPGELASLVPEVGPNAPGILQVGALAQQTSASGQYSVNPSTGQLVQNMIPGVSNSALVWIAGGLVGFVLLAGISGGRR